MLKGGLVGGTGEHNKGCLSSNLNVLEAIVQLKTGKRRERCRLFQAIRNTKPESTVLILRA